MDTPKHKIFCFNNGGSPGWYSAVAIGDDGVCVAVHCCSREGYMSHDLGITSDWKHELYNAQYGEGNWELEWVHTEQVKDNSHAGLMEALRLNQLQADLAKEKEGEPDGP